MSNIRGSRNMPYKVYHYRPGEKRHHGVELAKNMKGAKRIAKKWRVYGHRARIVKRSLKRMR